MQTNTMDTRLESDQEKQAESQEGEVPSAAEELRHCREALNRETLRRTELLAQLGQRLRTRLNHIIGSAELLEMQCRNSAAANNARQILEAARDLLDIINHEIPSDQQTRVAKAAEHSSCDVLYIEDDPVNFALVKRILQGRPSIKLAHAPRGEIGISLAQTHSPKLILLDLNLPDIHGSEVLRRLQQNSETARVPVVVISADATASQIERLLSAGARNYVTKPFRVQSFVAVVDELLQESTRSS
jgi:CheY-like chemotaxis protein